MASEKKDDLATVELAPGAKQQTWEYDDATKMVTWLIRKFPGGSVQVRP